MSEPPRPSRLAERVRGVLDTNGTRLRAPVPAGDPTAREPVPAPAAVPAAAPTVASAGTEAAPRSVPAARLPISRPTDSDALERALGGAWTDEGGVRCFVVERRLAPAERCGAVRVGDIAERIETATTAVRTLVGGDPANPPYLFFDLETTGLSGGAGTYAFLVGCARFEPDGALRCRQLVVSHPGHERAMLQRLSREFAGAGALVSFNGRSFDAPLLEMRYAFHRLGWPGETMPHLDVLHPARRFWSARHKESDGDGSPHGSSESRPADRAGSVRDVGVWWRSDDDDARRLRSCSLVALEQQVLGIQRVDDIPGAEVPLRYFDFMRAGDARVLAPVLEHNRHDLLSLTALMARLLHLLDTGPGSAQTARESLALGRLYERTDAARAREALVRAVELTRQTGGQDRLDRGHQGRLDWGHNGREVRAQAQRSLALMARRCRHYDEAAGWWRGVLRDAPRGSVLAREASEALAVHAEHRQRDLAAARRFALEGRTSGGAGWGRAVDRRLARLERKLAAASGSDDPQLLEPLD